MRTSHYLGLLDTVIERAQNCIASQEVRCTENRTKSTGHGRVRLGCHCLPEASAQSRCVPPRQIFYTFHRERALLRRNRASDVSEGSPQAFGDCLLDPKTFELKRGNKSVSLSPREVRLFQIFIGHPNEVLSGDRLLNEVWGYEYYCTTRTLDHAVVQLRKKLSDLGADPKQIATVHAYGYKFSPQ